MASSQNSIADQVREFVANRQGVTSDDMAFTSDINLFDAGYLDSVGMVELIAFLESTFSVSLEEQHFFSDEFTNLNGIARLVEQLQS
jgi:acyl carrier protein